MKSGILSASLAIILLSGCGGGGGGSSSPSAQESVTAIETNTIRQYTVGDSWTFSGTGEISENGVRTSFDVSATESVTGTKKNPVSLETVLILTANVVLSNENGSFTAAAKTYYTQDAEGSIYRHGGVNGHGQEYWLNQGVPEKTIVSPMAVGRAVDITYTEDGYTSGAWSYLDSVSYSYAVQAKEAVTTGLGEFEAYRASISRQDSTSTSTMTSWFHPALGEVKLTENYTEPDYSMNWTLTLQDTNVAF